MKALSELAIEAPDDALQCLHDQGGAASIPESTSDETRFQLAKLASNAAEALSNGGETVLPRHQVLVAGLWRSYLEQASATGAHPGMLNGITLLLHFARWDAFESHVPALASAMARTRSKLPVEHANQLFTTLKRCRNWLDVKYVGPLRCTPSCAELGRDAVATVEEAFSSTDGAMSEGARRLLANAKAFARGLSCSDSR